MRPAPTAIRGSSAGLTSAGTALLLSATAEGAIVVGNAVDHPDAAVEVLLMYTVGDGVGDPGSLAELDGAGQCMIVALRGLPADAGADNTVVFVDSAAPHAQQEHAGAREPAVW